MGKIKGTRTEKNLLAAFAGESQARNHYTYFGGQARKDGFVQIADIFIETAEQEKEHAKRFFKFLEGGELEISATFPAGVVGATLDNLKAAAAGEHHEHTSIYPGFARVAEEEGFKDVAAHLPRRVGGREAAREALPGAGCEHRGRPRLQARHFGDLALPQLRLPARGPRGARALPGLRCTRRPTSSCWERIGRE